MGLLYSFLYLSENNEEKLRDRYWYLKPGSLRFTTRLGQHLFQPRSFDVFFQFLKTNFESVHQIMSQLLL